ncbi:hypothetical protein MSAR_32720 [Mycolicibacterium sarraceniae]|uniref:Uncharacterized protein n=1 Tax=Mycolicibacterium sarraceniae TaxID=1534348 RepID=A0A7I7SWC5_9MYCO|nr:hypothetical protein MSAR_32720 [Mycolicibacterium sarraceniae]
MNGSGHCCSSTATSAKTQAATAHGRLTARKWLSLSRTRPFAYEASVTVSVPRPIDHAKREDLPATADVVLARTGVVGTFLREPASQMGTSARMHIAFGVSTTGTGAPGASAATTVG